MQAGLARQQHNVLQKHTVVEPAAGIEVVMNREDSPGRGTEKFEIAPVLRFHFFLIAFLDAEQRVEIPANLAAPAEERFEEFIGVVGLFGIVRDIVVVSLQYTVANLLQCIAKQQMHTPRLHIGAAGCA